MCTRVSQCIHFHLGKAPTMEKVQHYAVPAELRFAQLTFSLKRSERKDFPN